MNFLVFLEPCEDPTFLSGLSFVQSIVQVLFIVIPIGLIVMLMIDLVKCVISNDSEQKKQVSLIVKRILYSVMAFFVPTIVNLMLNLVSEYVTDVTSDYNNCLANIDRIDYFQRRADELEKAEKKERKEASDKKKAGREALLAKQAAASARRMAKTSDSYVGQTYNLDDNLLTRIADKCAHEQPGIEGVKAEASLMANRFELFGSKFGTGATGLDNYVYNSGWFGSGNSNVKATDKQKAAVKEVLVNGNRTLPLYVDEHDCIDCGQYGFDIIKIVNDGNTITDQKELVKHSNYIKNKTLIYNKYGKGKDFYTFYTFPSNDSDPFGYTSWAYDKYKSLKG